MSEETHQGERTGHGIPGGCRISDMEDTQRMGITGTGLTPTTVANSILRRAFRDHVPVTPMKLQKLLFFTTCLYQRQTRRRLLTESFQPWRYGPVCRSVYDEFRAFGARPITRYAQDALDNVSAVDESTSPQLHRALDRVWAAMGGMSAVALSRITHWEGSAWSRAVNDHKNFISNTAMADDHTFDSILGI